MDRRFCGTECYDCPFCHDCEVSLLIKQEDICEGCFDEACEVCKTRRRTLEEAVEAMDINLGDGHEDL